MDGDLHDIACALLPWRLGQAVEALGLCGGAERFMAMERRDLVRLLGYDKPWLTREARDAALVAAGRETAWASRTGVRLITACSPAYPRLLAGCPDAPPLLEVKGDADLDNVLSLAVVGTRRVTAGGMAWIDATMSDLAAKVDGKPMIVSGLAYGVDVCAHRAALREGLPTVAVLAHGLRHLYPAAHADVARTIIRNGGALVSEYPCDKEANKGTFLARNRIIAGLSAGTLVAESAVRGGAMKTAADALEYNRTLMAVPGRPDDKYSAGCIALIRDSGARLVCSADDIAAAMGWRTAGAAPVQQTLFQYTTPEEDSILNILASQGDTPFGTLLRLTGLNAGALGAMLVDLESRGLLTALPGSNYRARGGV